MDHHKEIDFIIDEMTYLRYFIPIAKEAKLRNIKVNFFCNWDKKKYNSLRKNKQDFNLIVEEFNICIHEINNIRNRNIPVIIIEDRGLEYLKKFNFDQKIYSITYSGDFIRLYNKYSERVNNIFMMSKFFAEYYNCCSEKNVYCGIPKFDVKYKYKDILDKYNLKESENYALLLYPRKRDLPNVNLERIYSVVSELGLKLLVKTRGKDPIFNKKNMGDKLFVDDSWFPYTSIELIYLSSIVINFGSSAVEECVMLDTPIIDFECKPPGKKFFNQLYHFDFAKVLNSNSGKDLIKESIFELINKKFTKDFKKARDKYLYENDYLSSSKILNFIFSNI